MWPGSWPLTSNRITTLRILVKSLFFLGRQSFRVEQAFSICQIGGRVMPEPALERACCLALSELLAQSTPLRQILRPQLSGAKGIVWQVAVISRTRPRVRNMGAVTLRPLARRS